MSSINEVGKCEVCGKDNVYLVRTYFNYRIPGINCSCHNSDHSVLVCHCNDCVPKEPRYIKVEFRTADLNRLTSDQLTDDNIDVSNSINKLVGTRIPDATISVKKAMEVLTKALTDDKAEGSYYYIWQSNIACAIMDNSKIDHDTANMIAKKFLDQLCAK